MSEYIKEFDEWNKVKKELGCKGLSKTFYAKEIWWASIGVNVGSEQDGKGELYIRPVYVLKKINSKTFIGVPLTSNVRISYMHVPFYFNYSFTTAILSQIKLFDKQRLVKRIGNTSDYLHQKMKKATIAFILS